MLTTKRVFTCSKSTMETPKQCVKSVLDAVLVPLLILHCPSVFTVTLNKCRLGN